MCRTVTDAAVLASVIAERPLGFGAHGTDIEAFRLRGVRIGVMPVRSRRTRMRPLVGRCARVLQQEGAVLVDLKSPAAFDEMDEPELEALLYEFKAAITVYLSTLDPSQVDCRTLADLIDFNRAHADEELIVFGQEIFEMAQMRGILERSCLPKGAGPATHRGCGRTRDTSRSARRGGFACARQWAGRLDRRGVG